MRRIRIGFVLVAALGSLALLVALSFAWVAFYSHVLHPGETLAFYQAYARAASPWVSIVAGIPLWFWLGAFARARLGRAADRSALAAFALYALLSLAATAGAGQLVALAWLELLSLGSKLAAVLLALRMRPPASA